MALRGPLAQGGVVLDLACGDGALGEHLLASARRVLFYDLSEAELSMARRELSGAGSLLLGRVQQLPLKTECLDAVACHMALRLFDDVVEVIDEVARVLRPGGVFAATVNRAAELGSPMDLVFAELGRAMRDKGDDLTVPGDRRVSELDSLHALFPRQAWRNVEATDYELHVQVPAAEVPNWLQRAYYPIDQLANESDGGFMHWVEESVKVLAPEGTMTWTFALRELVVRRR